jgi:hypothetical protein
VLIFVLGADNGHCEEVLLYNALYMAGCRKAAVELLPSIIDIDFGSFF